MCLQSNLVLLERQMSFVRKGMLFYLVHLDCHRLMRYR